MNILRPVSMVCMGIILCNSSFGQITQPVTTGRSADLSNFAIVPSPDPALRHNRLLQERIGDGVYQQIGNYKVTGTSYLFGGGNKGDMFSKEAKAYNITLSYNTFNQEVAFTSTSNPDQPLIKEPGDLDSFILHANAESGITKPVKFVYGQLTGSKDKAYFQEVYAGSKYSIYKKYKSELGYVSDNYVQSELRQFDLTLEYFYIGTDKKMKKIKANASNVIKEFKDAKDLSGVINHEMFTANPDDAFQKAFEQLNN